MEREWFTRRRRVAILFGSIKRDEERERGQVGAYCTKVETEAAEAAALNARNEGARASKNINVDAPVDKSIDSPRESRRGPVAQNDRGL